MTSNLVVTTYPLQLPCQDDHVWKHAQPSFEGRVFGPQNMDAAPCTSHGQWVSQPFQSVISYFASKKKGR